MYRSSERLLAAYKERRTHHKEPTAVDLWAAEGTNFSLTAELKCADESADDKNSRYRSWMNESPCVGKDKDEVGCFNDQLLTELFYYITF